MVNAITGASTGSGVGKYASFVVGGAVLLIGVSILFGSMYTVDQRERGVILRNGKLIGTALPGLNFKWPLIDKVVKISLEQQSYVYDKLNSYSRDQQPADITVTVNLQAMEGSVDELYTEYGSVADFVSRRITPKVNEELKTVFGRYNAVTAIQERGRLNQDVRAAVIKAIAGSGNTPINVTDVQITNIDFSDAYEKSIEQRMLAEVEVQKVLQNAEREKATALITVTKAQAQADAVLAEAKAQAQATTLRGNAEADAIRAKGAALGSNPNLVTLVQAEKWDGKLPVTMLPGSGVPMINLTTR